MELNKDFWQDKYDNNATGWDIGQVSPPIKAFVDRQKDKHQRILIPGAGRAYEAVYLFQNGFPNVFVCDLVYAAFDHLRTVSPEFPNEQLLVCDFFELEGQYDLILEQTFFCAIAPSLRPAYVQKISALLSPGKTLAGLLFASEFDKPGPPFGGTEKEYRTLFSTHFHLKQLHVSKNSILPRAENELFFEFIRK